jgi:uncharacterized protein with FMN-binding domain
MPKRPIFGTILAGAALALLLAFKTPSETGLTGSNGSPGSNSRSTYSGQLTGSAIQTPYGIVQVRLTLSNGKITEITVLQAPQGGRDTQLTNYAVPQLRSEVLAAQSAQVDTISGATYTSMGYLRSVQSALDQSGTGFTGNGLAQAGATTGATSGPAAAAATSANGGSTTQGNYSGTLTGQAVQMPYGVVQVTVTLSNGKITDVTVLQAPQSGRSGQIAQYATPQLRSEVLAAQSANVNTVSGATYTSQGYMQSVQSALDQAGIKG